MDYKNTLNLPKTAFSMKADLPRREPEFLARWQAMDLYAAIMARPASQGTYILHDGPPYANGNIHIGHALNKTLKDIIVKYKSMRGFHSPYVPGWDCHGLPVEHALIKELKITKQQISQAKADFRKKAHDYAMKYVAIQREEFKRLGVFGDWDDPYLTLSRDYEEAIVRSLGRLVEKGYIYQGRKPVNWCYKCETALAEAEVEYEDHASPSVYVKFKLEEAPGILPESFLVIWTTTPWTLVANVAVAVHPDFSYSYIQTDKGNLIIADVRLGVLEKLGIGHFELIRKFKGSDLEKLTYRHPFGLRTGRVVLAEYVSAEEGTGLVHTAPGHGAEDYQTGSKYGLETVMPVDAKGKYFAAGHADQQWVPVDLQGMFVLDANAVIIEKLKAQADLLNAGSVSHTYPHCWRCKSPIIFRATEQWFLNVDHEGLRKKLLQAVGKVSWIPPEGKDRIAAMIETRPDWCLSRQRFWGVPIPALACRSCGKEFLDLGVINAFAEKVAVEGSDSWFIRPVEDFIPQGFVCPVCKKAGGFLQGSDILDVWFDSGVSHQAVLRTRKELAFPAALYLEGSDQHRGWFQSSLIPALCIEGMPPFESVLTHGHVVDGEGRKMSKSMGNVIPPQDIIKHYGADIIRLWVAASGYNEDIRISDQIIARLVEAYRKIRNTCRFILSNLYDFDPDTGRVPYADFKTIDRWIVWRLEKVKEEVARAYDAFEFHRAYKALYDFCNEDLSMYYLDMVKGRLYTCAAGSKERRAAQTAQYEVIAALARMMAPIVVFTAEDIWDCLAKNKAETAASVHLAHWPQPNPEYAQQGEPKDIGGVLSPVFELMPSVTKLLEEKRVAGQIGSSFDAKINVLTKDQSWYKFLESLRPDLPEIFKVSQVSVRQVTAIDPAQIVHSAYPDIAIEVLAADGKKCQRCWNYAESVGAHEAHPQLCARCLAVIQGGTQIEEDRKKGTDPV